MAGQSDQVDLTHRHRSSQEFVTGALFKFLPLSIPSFFSSSFYISFHAITFYFSPNPTRGSTGRAASSLGEVPKARKVCRWGTSKPFDGLAGKPTDVRQHEHFRFYMARKTVVVPGRVYRSFRISSRPAVYVVVLF